MFRYFIRLFDMSANEDRIESGLTSGSNYTEAATKVLNYYGDNISSNRCQIWDFRLYRIESVLDEEELQYLLLEGKPEDYLNY